MRNFIGKFTSNYGPSFLQSVCCKIELNNTGQAGNIFAERRLFTTNRWMNYSLVVIFTQQHLELTAFALKKHLKFFSPHSLFWWTSQQTVGIFTGKFFLCPWTTLQGHMLSLNARGPHFCYLLHCRGHVCFSLHIHLSRTCTSSFANSLQQ